MRRARTGATTSCSSAAAPLASGLYLPTLMLAVPISDGALVEDEVAAVEVELDPLGLLASVQALTLGPGHDPDRAALRAHRRRDGLPRLALSPLRVRGLDRVRLHADLTILAKLATVLARERAVPLAA